MENLPLFSLQAVNFVFQVLTALSSAENRHFSEYRNVSTARQTKIHWSLELLKMV